jgi:hypothetical protein
MLLFLVQDMTFSQMQNSKQDKEHYFLGAKDQADVALIHKDMKVLKLKEIQKLKQRETLSLVLLIPTGT